MGKYTWIGLFLVLTLFSECKKKEGETIKSTTEVVEIKSSHKEGAETKISHFYRLNTTKLCIGVNEKSMDFTSSFYLFGAAIIDVAKPINKAYTFRTIIHNRDTDSEKTGGILTQKNILGREAVISNKYHNGFTTFYSNWVGSNWYASVSNISLSDKYHIEKVIEHQNGFIAVCNSTNKFNIIRTTILSFDKDLNYKDSKSFRFDDNTIAVDAVVQNDGSIAIAGYTEKNKENTKHCWLLKYNTQTNDTFYTKWVGNTNGFKPSAMIQNTIGDIYIAGSAPSPITTAYNGYILSVNDSFDVLWQQAYTLLQSGSFDAITLSDDEQRIILAGHGAILPNKQTDAFVVLTDIKGKVLGDEKFGSDILSEMPLGIIIGGENFYMAINRKDASGKLSAAFAKGKLP